MAAIRKPRQAKAKPNPVKPAWMRAAEDLEAGRITPDQIPDIDRELVVKLVENSRALVDHHAERVLRGRTRERRQELLRRLPKGLQAKVEKRVWQLWRERKAANDNRPASIDAGYRFRQGD